MTAAELAYDDISAYDDTWYADSIWKPEEEAEEDSILVQDYLDDIKNIKQLSLKPSEFTEFAFRMPRHVPTNKDETPEQYEARMEIFRQSKQDPFFENFSFKERPYMRRIYDTPAQRVLLCCARQTEKSTLLGNLSLCYMSMIPSYKMLYVNSSATQAKTFSNDRVKEPIDTSLVLKGFTKHMLSSNIFEKQLINRSKITIRYAFLNADRCRGIPTYGLTLDEFQDILPDNIPIIEQCASHSPPDLKRQWYAGTPKSLDNNLETYWSKYSTQNQWVIPHDCKLGEGGRYWNILGEKNIGKGGLICSSCGKRITPMAEDAQWAAMQQMEYDKWGSIKGDVSFEGFRIPQLMVPWKPWKEILLDYESYPRDKFYNEVLGISYDSGIRPLSRADIIQNCRSNIYMSEAEKLRELSYRQPFYAGLDYGTGENSYTVLTIGTYIDGKFRIVYMHRFEGSDTEMRIQMEKVIELIDWFNIRTIGADYGGGFNQNDLLKRKYGPLSLMQFQYVARGKRKVMWNPGLQRYIVSRTEVMADIFAAIKRGTVFEFPRWEEFEKPFGQDMLNIYSEYNEKLRMLQYGHLPGKTDDGFHSVLYCFLGSMSTVQRPDIITPRREENGKMVSNWVGPINQG